MSVVTILTPEIERIDTFIAIAKNTKVLALNVVTFDFELSNFSRPYLWHYKDL